MTPFALTVVVPCLNEAENIVPAYDEITAELSGYDGLELLFVDDGSTDDTLSRIKSLAGQDPRVRYLSLTRNFGLEAAFSAGYRYATQDWVLHLDADLQFPPSEARKLVRAAREGGYDAVFGVRVDRKDRLPRRLASGVNDFVARRLLGIQLPAGATTFRLVRASLARRIVDLDLGTPYFMANVPRLTNAWTTVPTAHRARERGEPKVSVRGLARHAVELFVSYSARPMAIAVAALMLSALLSLAGAVTTAFGSERPAVVALALASTLGFLALAVMARFLVHVARGRRDVPLFLVREANLEVAPEHLLEPRGVREVVAR